MKAIVFNRYGGPEVLEYAQVDRPLIREDELLVRVRATSVNPVDETTNDRSVFVGCLPPAKDREI